MCKTPREDEAIMERIVAEAEEIEREEAARESAMWDEQGNLTKGATECIRTGFLLGAAWYICQKQFIHSFVNEAQRRHIAEMLGLASGVLRGHSYTNEEMAEAAETAMWVYSTFVDEI